MDTHRRIIAGVLHPHRGLPLVSILLLILASVLVPHLLASTPELAPSDHPTSSQAHLLSPTCNQLLADPSFEERNDQVWERPITAYRAQYVQQPVHTGSWALQTGIANPRHNRFSYSSAQQRFTIPAQAKNVTLRFYLYRTSGAQPRGRLPEHWEEVDPREIPLATDAQYVLLLDERFRVVRTLVFTLAKQDPQWREFTFDLSRYAGRTLYIHFETYNDGRGGVTAQYVDDVTVEACTPVNQHTYLAHVMHRWEWTNVTPRPTPTPSPTPTPTPTPSPTPTPTPSPTPTPTQPASPLPTPTATPTSSTSPLPTPTPTNPVSPLPTPTATPTAAG